MSPASARQVVQSLHDATLLLQQALREEDDAGMARALELREGVLGRLAELGPLDPQLEPLLSEVRRLDAESLARANQRLAAVRAELEQIRRARCVVRSLESGERPARFVSERV